jgi:hypothetical protein
MHVYSLQFEFGCDFGGVDKGNDGNPPSLFSTQKHPAQVQHVLGNGEFRHSPSHEPCVPTKAFQLRFCC